MGNAVSARQSACSASSVPAGIQNTTHRPAQVSSRRPSLSLPFIWQRQHCAVFQSGGGICQFRRSPTVGIGRGMATFATKPRNGCRPGTSRGCRPHRVLCSSLVLMSARVVVDHRSPCARAPTVFGIDECTNIRGAAKTNYARAWRYASAGLPAFHHRLGQNIGVSYPYLKPPLAETPPAELSRADLAHCAPLPRGIGRGIMRKRILSVGIGESAIFIEIY